MAQQKDSNPFGLGIVIGSVIGGLAAFFLSPKSGKENREMVSQKIQELKTMIEEKQVPAKVQEIYGEVTTETTNMFNQAQGELTTRLDELKKTVDEIDVKKYQSMVNDVIVRVQEETKTSGERISKLKDYFMGLWGGENGKTAKKTTKTTKTTRKSAAKKPATKKAE